jgi:hypothetical protein
MSLALDLDETLNLSRRIDIRIRKFWSEMKPAKILLDDPEKNLKQNLLIFVEF